MDTVPTTTHRELQTLVFVSCHHPGARLRPLQLRAPQGYRREGLSNLTILHGMSPVPRPRPRMLLSRASGRTKRHQRAHTTHDLDLRNTLSTQAAIRTPSSTMLRIPLIHLGHSRGIAQEILTAMQAHETMDHCQLVDQPLRAQGRRVSLTSSSPFRPRSRARTTHPLPKPLSPLLGREIPGVLVTMNTKRRRVPILRSLKRPL